MVRTSILCSWFVVPCRSCVGSTILRNLSNSYDCPEREEEDDFKISFTLCFLIYYWHRGSCHIVVRHPALDILQFGKDLQSKPISLTPRPVPTVHIVPKGQNQTHDILQTAALQQLLKQTHTVVYQLCILQGHVTSCPLTGLRSYFAQIRDDHHFTTNGSDHIEEHRLENDTVGPTCEVRNLRELVEKPGRQKWRGNRETQWCHVLWQWKNYFQALATFSCPGLKPVCTGRQAGGADSHERPCLADFERSAA